MTVKRSRFICFVLSIFVIILGLLSRKYADFFPDFINVFLGDSLWALMIYSFSAMIFKSKSSNRLLILSLLVCYIVEFSQLYQAPWINQIRQTTIGHLVLGNTFVWTDLVSYTLGVLVGYWVDKWIFDNNMQQH